MTKDIIGKLEQQLWQMETIGETEMGRLPRRLAGRYHTITRNMRKLVDELRYEHADDPMADADERQVFIAEQEDTCGDCGVGAGEHADDCPRLEWSPEREQLWSK